MLNKYKKGLKCVINKFQKKIKLVLFNEKDNQTLTFKSFCVKHFSPNLGLKLRVEF